MFALLASGACLVALLLLSVRLAGGSLIYSLDDPYIHLALARTIQQGGYGINVGEWASPSSSILWPFLMAPWPANWLEPAPVVFNAVCCLLNVWILRDLLRGPLFTERQQWLMTLAFAFGLNLFGLVMTGMEHTLQTLLSTFVAWRLVRRRYDLLFYVALSAMPLVRYECMALSGAAALYLWFSPEGKRLKPALALGVTAAVMAAFSFFLHSKGMPLLPSSIMAKNAERSILFNALLNPGFYVILWWLHHGLKDRRLVFWLLCVLPLAAFLVLGRSGWFGRYEAFMAAWLMVFALDAAQRIPLPSGEGTGWWYPRSMRRFVLGLSLSLPALWICTLLTPLASADIARQQAVMAEVAHELAEPVAVNDLGLVALRSGQYVLDLWGLGSPEVLSLRLSGRPAVSWLGEITRRKQVRHVFIFEKWFPKQPAGWIKVGELKLDVPRVVVPSDAVSLFATDAEAAVRLREALSRIAARDADKARLIRIHGPGGPPLHANASVVER